MQNTFAILGAGMQGTCAAYDIAKFSPSTEIHVADVNLEQAEKAANRVNTLVGKQVCIPHQVDVLNPNDLAEFLTTVDCVISCVPYWMHPIIAKVAVETITDMVDLGGHTESTLKTLELDAEAKENEITIIPDTGLAPGLVNSIGMYMIESLDQTDSIKLYCGVLPQNPQPPFNYKLTFNMEGLVTEYDYEGVILRDGKVQTVPTLTELETLHVDQLGEMEAFVTSGGTSTAPLTLEGKVKNYEYKTIRYPGHCERIKIFKDFGFWSEDELEVKGSKVRPKDVFNAVFGPALNKYQDKDLCIVRGIGTGTRNGRPTTIQVDIFDKEDDETGFTSMERLTGFSTAIVALEVVQGNTPKGAVRYEKAMSGRNFLRELARRGVQIKVSECEQASLD